ncbi:MAG: hypothetical protein ABJN96_08885 [Marinomonas sp.]
MIKNKKEGGLNIYKHITLFVIFFFSMTNAMAKTSINEIHSCLALVDFVNSKLESSESTYSPEDKAIIHKGLFGYARYLENDVIDPKLLKLYGGNVAQAKLMKKLFNRQQSRFIEYLDERHAERKFATDYVIAIKECSVKTRSQGDVALYLRQALTTMEKLDS